MSRTLQIQAQTQPHDLILASPSQLELVHFNQPLSVIIAQKAARHDRKLVVHDVEQRSLGHAIIQVDVFLEHGGRARVNELFLGLVGQTSLSF